ncbi:potassium transporter TrkA [Actinoplanes sp. NPDC049316]|uniref:potassium transporter TrkA n=1 Tax=Actinoplanes sp. NPDC049316 TaxID=3154727 RepID=UPI00343F6329
MGVTYVLTTAEGRRIGVVTHLGGRRDLVAYDPDDPDSAQSVAALTETEARTVAELLGGPVYVDRRAPR